MQKYDCDLVFDELGLHRISTVCIDVGRRRCRLVPRSMRWPTAPR